MNQVLDQLSEIITEEALSQFRVKKIAVGKLKDVYKDGSLSSLISQNDLPAILISPDTSPTSNSQFANHIKKTFNITLTIIYNSYFPTDSIKDGNKLNQVPTSGALENELFNLLSKNKTLNGVVTGWSKQWKSIPDIDGESNQLLMIKTSWENERIPFVGITGNQTNTTVDLNQQSDNNFFDL